MFFSTPAKFLLISKFRVLPKKQEKRKKQTRRERQPVVIARVLARQHGASELKLGVLKEA